MMHYPDIAKILQSKNATFGITHFAINVGSKKVVNVLTERLRNDGVAVVSEPRHTKDGYCEAAILDVEGNYVEITT